MAEQLTRPVQSSDQAIGSRSKRVWVLFLVAPVMWLGLWLTAVSLSGYGMGDAPHGEASLRNLRPWIMVTADLGLLGWVALRLRRAGRKVADIGLSADWLGREALIGALAGSMLWGVSLGPLWVLGLRDLNPIPSSLLTVHALTRLAQLGIIAVGEEVVWRGYVITELHRLYRLSVSVAIAVGAFSVFYLGDAVVFDWLTFPLMAFMGGWLSLLYLWRRSLIAPIVAHFIFGGLGVSS